MPRFTPLSPLHSKHFQNEDRRVIRSKIKAIVFPTFSLVNFTSVTKKK